MDAILPYLSPSNLSTIANAVLRRLGGGSLSSYSGICKDVRIHLNLLILYIRIEQEVPVDAPLCRPLVDPLETAARVLSPAGVFMKSSFGSHLKRVTLRSAWHIAD